MGSVVIDTNVPIVANGATPSASVDCQLRCIEKLVDARNQLVLVDDGQRIFDEYRKHLSHAGQPGVGDAFFKWLWENQANESCCLQVTITNQSDDPNDFAEFPTDPDLSNFDRSDRKFVAVALGSAIEPEIMNAVDSDWWIFREALGRNGLNLTFVCGKQDGWS